MTTPLISKTRLMSARQCLKRAWLEVHRSELAAPGATNRMAMRAGREVGAAARQIYGSSGAHLIELQHGFDAAIARTKELLLQRVTTPVFEATLTFAGVVIRADVLQREGPDWHLVEVKASTQIKEEHAFDCAIQSWVLKQAGVTIARTSLAHVDNQFTYPGNNDYSGLLIENDMQYAIDPLLPLVADHVAVVRDTLGGGEPDIGVGKHCFHPWECPFVAYCWPAGIDFPVQNLGGSKAKLGELVTEGFRDLRDVPAGRLTARQRRIQTVTRSGHAELSPEAAREVAMIGYPRYFIDFETIAPAVPIWPGTRPYAALPFQWSCHFEPEPGDVRHAEFLDLTGDSPMRRVAESLIRVLGSTGTVLMYTTYERQVINGLIASFPDLEAPLSGIVARLLDLKDIVARHYYHPRMHGSWSLKAVLPTIAPELSYTQLEGIQDGSDASEGYIEAIQPATSAARRSELDKQLRRYCRIDTEAMVRLTNVLAAAAD
ncbi:MAG TPA: DUF2779 domain-containing protein [Woeseiaceae bacterium]